MSRALENPARRNRGPDVRVRPLTPEKWDDLVSLFGSRGACGGCWCMYWRKPRPQFEAGKGERNRAALKRLAELGAPLGVIGYVNGRPAGWCAVAPRAEYVRLASSRILKPVDDLPVWSVTCFFVAKKHRGGGLSVRLLEGAARYARSLGAVAVEGYPVDPKGARGADVFMYTGLLSTFARAGFREVARRSPGRPIMRRQWRATSASREEGSGVSATPRRKRPRSKRRAPRS